MIPERYFERRQIREALEFARGGGIAVHRNFDHYDGHRSGRGLEMIKPFLHVIGRRPLLEEWGRRCGLRPEWIQPEKRRDVAHYDVFGEFAQQLIDRLTMPLNVADEFRRFAGVRSPLYAHLSSATADDDKLLALAGHAGRGQPAPNLLFAAVHYLLLTDAHHRLAAYYPSVGGSEVPDGNTFPFFRQFCLEQSIPIKKLIGERGVRTDEVGRSASLLPAFETIARRARRPLALIEVGASAGLNLNFDLYAYDYGAAGRVGDRSNPVHLAVDVRGDIEPPLPGPDRFPAVASRIGIDLRPVDVRDPDQTLWLEALVWPDQWWRSDLLRAAIGAARAQPATIVSGDLLEVLPALLESVPRDVALTVYHTYAVYQLTAEARDRLTALLAAVGARRDLFWLSLEWFSSGRPLLELSAWQGGQRSDSVLAACHEHGQWLQWLDSSNLSG